MIQSKDVIHLYLGCEVIGTYNDQTGSKGYLTGVTNGGVDCEIQFIEEDGINVSEEPEYSPVADVKLILRPLCDMTEEEAIALGKMLLIPNGAKYSRALKNDRNQWEVRYGNTVGDFWTIDGSVFNQFQTIFLLNHSFDIFGLIESGKAITKTK